MVNITRNSRKHSEKINAFRNNNTIKRLRHKNKNKNMNFPNMKNRTNKDISKQFQNASHLKFGLSVEHILMAVISS